MTSETYNPAVTSLCEKNDVFLSVKPSYENVWTVEHTDPSQRFEQEGEPVKV